MTCIAREFAISGSKLTSIGGVIIVTTLRDK